MTQWIVETNKENLKEIKIPSYQANMGKKRLQLAAEILGEEIAARLANEKEYIIDESLVEQLQLSGIRCTDEIAHLSPKKWLKSVSAQPFHEYKKKWNEQGMELKGIILSKEEKKILEKVLKAQKIHSPWDLLEIADHIFFPTRTEFTLLF